MNTNDTREGGTLMPKFKVIWIDCEGQDGWMGFVTRGEAEQFAQWCRELGDRDVRVEEID